MRAEIDRIPPSTESSNRPITIVEASALEKTFNLEGKPIEVLRGIDLRLESGSSVAIVGPSGAGKSTLLHILGLLEKQTGGKYFFSGQETSILTEREKAELRLRKIGFIFQFHHLLPEFTALENVMLPALMLGKPKQKASEIAVQFLEQVGLQNRANHRPGELSGGEQQRVALARALVNEPSLILADEPTGNLDLESATLTADLLLKVPKTSNSVLILVTHNRKLADETDQVYFMDNGRIALNQA